MLADRPEVLVDTGPFCRLAEAGEVQFDVAAEFLGEKLRIVTDVQRELRRRAGVAQHSRLHRLDTLGLPRTDPIEITDASLLSRVNLIVEGRQRHKSGHPDEDRGEVATVLVAAELGLAVLVDDGFGKHLAKNEGVDVYTTQDLAVELAARDLLKSLYAFGLYRIVYEDATKSAFDALVTELREDLAPSVAGVVTTGLKDAPTTTDGSPSADY